jgi:lipid-A-disaccharide synthase
MTNNPSQSLDIENPKDIILSYKPKKIFIIAGEESGDNLGAKLLKDLKSEKLEINLIGGQNMERQGFSSLFPISEINLMGFAEILPHIPNLLKRINETAEYIMDNNIDVVVTIDSPGFNYRVAKKLKDKKYNGKIIHYVAPTVWAYKPERAKKTANLFDHLMCILPWEKHYFEKEGLKTSYVGHPVFDNLKILSDDEKNIFKEGLINNNTKVTADSKIISCLVGSRKGEIKNLLPIYIDALNLINEKYKNITFAFLNTDRMNDYVLDYLKSKDVKFNYFCETEREEKHKILQISDCAIVKSGTISLEVAALNCPHIICYKVNALSYYIIKKMVKIDNVNLVNISANIDENGVYKNDSEIIPELIQSECNAKNIFNQIAKILENNDYKQNMLSKIATQINKLRV